MDNNICRFVPLQNNDNSIHTINFVLETEKQIYNKLKSDSVYKMYYVRSGCGLVHTCGKSVGVEKGNVFFTFPGHPFAIESVRNFSYMYISYVGLRANEIMEKLKITSQNFIFHNADDVQPFWEKGISMDGNVVDLISEAVLLYTFSFLGNNFEFGENKLKKRGVDFIKKYIDDHFTECDFSLENISQALSYNKKYISHTFKARFGIGIIEYLNTIRIQNACTMIEQGFTSVSDISEKCGYSDSRYFSKVFKQKIGITPTEYIKKT